MSKIPPARANEELIAALKMARDALRTLIKSGDVDFGREEFDAALTALISATEALARAE